MFKLLLTMMLMFVSYCQANVFETADKVYIDAESFNANTEGDEFYIHTGNNIWLVTHTINRDAQGMFAYQSNLSKSAMGPGAIAAYEKKWRCPYCYHYWPMGQACANAACPSKY